jgi:iron complex outermembrane receptor protein
MNDMIDIVYDNADNLFYYDNISKITAHGVEMGVDARLDQSTHFYANYSYQEAIDSGSKTRLTNSPANLVKCGIAGPLVKKIVAAGDIRYESERKTVYGTRTDAYILTNFKLSTKTIRDHVKLSLMIRNVFDVPYDNPGGFEHLQDCIRQDGRNYIFKVHLYY